MKLEEFQLIPLHYRILRLYETRDIDIMIYTLNRISGVDISKLRQLEYLVKRTSNRTVINGETKYIIAINDALSKIGVHVDSVEPYIDNCSIIRFDTSMFFMKSY